MKTDNTITNIFISIMLVTAIVGYDIAHTPKVEVQAKEPEKVQEVVASPTPTLELTTEAEGCNYITPYDEIIESVWGDDHCNAKAILRWKDVYGNTYGENGRYIVDNIDVIQKNGSVDRGLYRINSDTFNDYMRRMPNLLKDNGIEKWSDMNELDKNVKMGRIIYRFQGWCAWFAAPNDLCSNNYKGVVRESF